MPSFQGCETTGSNRITAHTYTLRATDVLQGKQHEYSNQIRRNKTLRAMKSNLPDQDDWSTRSCTGSPTILGVQYRHLEPSAADSDLETASVPLRRERVCLQNAAKRSWTRSGEELSEKDKCEKIHFSTADWESAPRKSDYRPSTASTRLLLTELGCDEEEYHVVTPRASSGSVGVRAQLVAGAAVFLALCAFVFWAAASRHAPLPPPAPRNTSVFRQPLSDLDVVSHAALRICNIRNFGALEGARLREGLAAALHVEAGEVQILQSSSSAASGLNGWLSRAPLDIDIRFSVEVPIDFDLKSYGLLLHEVTNSGKLKESLSAHGISCRSLHGKHLVRYSSR